MHTIFLGIDESFENGQRKEHRYLEKTYKFLTSLLELAQSELSRPGQAKARIQRIASLKSQFEAIESSIIRCLGSVEPDIMILRYIVNHASLGIDDLRLMSVDKPSELISQGQSLAIIALVASKIHIRIFDAYGRKIIDKTEQDLVDVEYLTLIALKQKLDPFPDESNLSKAANKNSLKMPSNYRT